MCILKCVQADRPARNPLGYLPRARFDEPVIRDMSLTPFGNGTGEVAVVVEKPLDDMDLNEVRLITRDGAGVVASDRGVRFNERESINLSPEDPEFVLEDGSSIRLEPECFRLEALTQPRIGHDGAVDSSLQRPVQGRTTAKRRPIFIAFRGRQALLAS